jgi:hypothetical protein
VGDRAKKGRASQIVGGILDEALKTSVENKISPFIIQELREKTCFQFNWCGEYDFQRPYIKHRKACLGETMTKLRRQKARPIKQFTNIRGTQKNEAHKFTEKHFLNDAHPFNS